MAILKNVPGGAVVFHTAANATLVIAGNSSVSNIAVGSETVAGASISRIITGNGNGAFWTVKRGANTVAVADGTEAIDFSAHGISLNQDASANVVVTLNGADGFITLELKKIF